MSGRRMRWTSGALVLALGLSLLWGCSTLPVEEGESVVDTERPEDIEETEEVQISPTPGAVGALADVISVEASGEAGAYRFSVGIESPDQGCDQYADWWEVVSQEGELIYRRVLLHSHTNEQPFVRSGGPVEIQAGTVVWVRAHMNADGYGGQVFKGSVDAGFESADLSADFAVGLADQPPLPEDCAF